MAMETGNIMQVEGLSPIATHSSMADGCMAKGRWPAAERASAERKRCNVWRAESKSQEMEVRGVVKLETRDYFCDNRTQKKNANLQQALMQANEQYQRVISDMGKTYI